MKGNSLLRDETTHICLEILNYKWEHWTTEGQGVIDLDSKGSWTQKKIVIKLKEALNRRHGTQG